MPDGSVPELVTIDAGGQPLVIDTRENPMSAQDAKSLQLKLSRQSITEQYGEDKLAALPKAVVATVGMTADQAVGTMPGIGSGAELVEALIEIFAQSKNALEEAQAEQDIQSRIDMINDRENEIIMQSKAGISLPKKRLKTADKTIVGRLEKALLDKEKNAR